MLKDQISGNVRWQSPSNIALIKYWGKYGDQLPQNPSISFTLDKSFTQTKISYRFRPDRHSPISTTFLFEGKENAAFQERIERYLLKRKDFLPFLSDLHLDIESTNSFPHSAGIASSASAFSALALALCDIERHLGDPGQDIDREKASELARLGSGSACRSVFPVAALWGNTTGFRNSSDRFAIPMQQEIHDIFKTFRDSILIVSEESKSVSSSVGHELMVNHPFAPARYQEARKNLEKMVAALADGDLETMGNITEMEAMQLHALMLCSQPNFVLLKPSTLKIIELVKTFRHDTKIPLYFTLDAGPNVHLLYPEDDRVNVQNFIQAELLTYCQKGEWIDDCVGSGPVPIS